VQQGCDPTELELMAPRYRTLAQQLRTTQRHLERTDRSAWQGTRAQRHWDRLDGLRPLLASSAFHMEGLARRLAHQASQQRRASLGTPALTVLNSSTVGDGRWVARTGAAGAALVVVLIPGVGTTRDDRHELRRDAVAVWTELAVAAADRGEQSVAVVSWLGYDPPDHVVTGIARRPAHVGGAQLAHDLAGLRRAGASRLVVVGHSYGALVAARGAHAGAPIDELVLLGAPGLGVADIDALGLSPGADVWAALADRDPIGLVAATGWVHGPDPLDVAHRLPTSLPGHGAYLEDPVLLAALAGLSLEGLSLEGLSLAGVRTEPVPSTRPGPTGPGT
jgi:pimeloyl-ACP methyl ester carboxylesterase